MRKKTIFVEDHYFNNEHIKFHAMQEWWASLDVFMKVMWFITATASLIFIVQTIMTFVGMDSDANLDTNMDGGSMTDAFPFQLFTFRNFVNFFLGFGWTAIVLHGKVNGTLTIIISCLVAILLVAAVMYIFYLMSKMEQSGNISTSSAVGCRGNVYLKIPAAKSGEGKVQITIQGAVREYDAITEGEALPNGAPIQVTAVVNETTLSVERI